MQQEENEKEIIIKPCNHTRLAAAFGISPKVLRNKLRPWQQQIGKRKGYKYSLEQLFIIFELIGLPQYPINNDRANLSEKLRHKKRVITIWDYERTILPTPKKKKK